MTEPDWVALEAAWAPARRAGVLGPAPLSTLIAHAAGFVPAAFRVGDFHGTDLGTGAGVPGLILAHLYTDSTWHLVDASERRCEFAAGAVRATRLGDRVTVIHDRAEAFAHDPAFRAQSRLVVARSFGPPEELAECALPLLDSVGRLVVSVTDVTTERWREGERERPEFRLDSTWSTESGRYLSVASSGVPEDWPRRPSTRRRRPVF